MKCCGPFQLVLLAFLSTSVTVVSALAGDSAYTFSINGKPVTPQHYSLNGDPSIFAPGDVIYVGEKEFDYGGLYMTLGEEKDCRFVAASTRTTEPQKPWDSRVFLELPDGRRKVVGLKVTWNTRAEPVKPSGQISDSGQGAKKQPSSDRIPYNPLDSMTPEEIHGLWGIQFIQWPKGIEQELAHVDTDRVCLTVNDGAGVGGQSVSLWGGGGPLFPPIPLKARYLVVEKRNSSGVRDFSRLGQLRDLIFLKFGRSLDVSLDAGLICQSASLRYLDVSGCGIPNYQKLTSCTELRSLNVSWCRDIANLDFAKNLHELRTLDVERTRIPSLSPLDNSNSIREIRAGMTQIRDLPKGALPSLRAINLVSSKVDAQAVEQFRKIHPACAVQYGWVDSLRTALRGTTRLRVRSGGTCHRRIEEEKTLVELTDAREIEGVLKAIDIDEGRSGGACMCCGNPTLEFYAGQRLLAMIGYHHGERLRWAGGTWTGDGELTSTSATFLNSWLSQRGVEGPRREVERQQRWQDEEARRQRRYAELIPAQTLRAISEALMELRSDNAIGDKRQKLTAEAFMKCEKDARTSVELYLRLLGVTANEGWNSYYDHQMAITKHLLPRFKGADLVQAGLGVMEDEEGMLGAARWLLWEKGWRNLDESDRERILPPLAQRALQHRYIGTRRDVMQVLSEINAPWAVTSLRTMLSRPTDPNWTPPEVKYGYRIDLPGGGEVRSDECSDAVWAAFCLAQMGNLESLPAIQKLAEESQKSDKDLLNKAIQLLREKGNKAPAGKE